MQIIAQHKIPLRDVTPLQATTSSASSQISIKHCLPLLQSAYRALASSAEMTKLMPGVGFLKESQVTLLRWRSTLQAWTVEKSTVMLCSPHCSGWLMLSG